jgi:MoaA/NifB/PqqE/SkfB family radical SAM enzyme
MINKKVELLKVGHINFNEDPNLLYILYPPTLSCNYNCDYCDFFKTHKFLNWDIKEKIISFINFLSEDRKCLLQLYGGEPTIDPDILKIVSSIKPHIRFYTNLSADFNMYDKIITSKNGDITITSSYHLQKADFNKFDDNVYKILNTNIKLFRIKVMADSRKKEESFKIFEYFEKKYGNYSNSEIYLNLVNKNRKNDLGSKWTYEDLNRYLESQQKIKDIEVKYKVVKEEKVYTEILPFCEVLQTLNDSNNYYKCFAGKNSIYIDPKGFVYYCKQLQEKPLFYVSNFKENLHIFNDGIICPFFGYCCDFEVPKIRICKRIVTKDNSYMHSFVTKEY